LHRASIAKSPTGFKLYSCQIYDNGTLIRDYVPCLNEVGVVGLYDKVENKFYGNAESKNSNGFIPGFKQDT
jgi:hypothetical protein